MLGLNAKGTIVRCCSAIGLHPRLWAISSTFWRYTLAAGIGTCGDIRKRTQRNTQQGPPQDIRDNFRFQIPLLCRVVQSRFVCIWSPLGNPSPLTFLQSFFWLLFPSSPLQIQNLKLYDLSSVELPFSNYILVTLSKVCGMEWRKDFLDYHFYGLGSKSGHCGQTDSASLCSTIVLAEWGSVSVSRTIGSRCLHRG